MSESSIMTLLVFRRLMPMLCPVSTTSTSLIVTFDADTSRLVGMYRPLSTAPSPYTSTHPRGSYFQPGPDDTWLGTESRWTEVGTPVLVASGYPHTCGEAAQPFLTGDRDTGAVDCGAPLVTTVVGNEALEGDINVPIGAAATTFVEWAAP